METPAESPATHAPSHCENCATPLQGKFCHQCGQSVHSPLRHAGHAIEEFFESFWHLDGRVFRTLRDLLFPGRAAARYLAGHRVDYVAPLRLFVVLSVLAFVVAQFAARGSGGGDAVTFNNVPVRVINGIGDAPTQDEVERLRSEAVADLQDVRQSIKALGSGGEKLQKAIDTVNRMAEQRIAALEQAEASGVPAESTRPDMGTTIAWDPAKDPIRVGWLPAPVNRWLTAQAAHARDNVPRFMEDPELFTHAFLGAVPKALFVLVPLFALLLKLAYLGSGRLYLEHLVVALYSHAWMLLALLALSLLAALGAWLAPRAAWIAVGIGGFNALLLCSMPVYLLLMQKRVYGEDWPATLLRFFVLGSVYCVLVGIAALALLVFSFVHG